MEQELIKINLEIKNSWKTFMKLSIMLSLGVVVFYSFFVYQEQQYAREYESTTWYIAEAELTDSTRYWETDDDRSEYMYEWHYTYVGKDGETYTYKDDEHSYEGTKGMSIQIYVDETDNSHALEIRDIKDKPFEMKFVVLAIAVILGPYALIFAICLLVLRSKRSKIMRELGRR